MRFNLTQAAILTIRLCDAIPWSLSQQPNTHTRSQNHTQQRHLINIFTPPTFAGLCCVVPAACRCWARTTMASSPGRPSPPCSARRPASPRGSVRAYGDSPPTGCRSSCRSQAVRFAAAESTGWTAAERRSCSSTAPTAAGRVSWGTERDGDGDGVDGWLW